jgi:hypothetical protein
MTRRCVDATRRCTRRAALSQCLIGAWTCATFLLGGTGTAPLLTKSMLIEWVRAEYSVFRLFAKFLTGKCLEASFGNPFAQGVNDMATLKNHVKFAAVGMQLVTPDYPQQNLALTLSMTPAKDGAKDNQVAKIVDERTKDITGHSYSTVAHSTITDVAAIGVCEELGTEREGCEMHQDDKIGLAVLGFLTRSSKKKEINAWPEGQALFAKMRAGAVSFSYSTRLEKLWALGVQIRGGAPRLKFKTDLNGTRVAAKHMLLYSFLRMNKLLKLWMIAENPSWKLTEEEWETLTEMEGILRISAWASTIVQYEKIFLGAMNSVIHKKMLDDYRAPSPVSRKAQLSLNPNFDS